MTIYSRSKRPEPSKYVSFINKIESPEFAQLEPSPKAPEARFVGVAQTLQNKRKSIKMTIYSRSKKRESLKYVSFINKIESPEFAQLDTSSHLGQNQAPLSSGSRPVAQKVLSRYSRWSIWSYLCQNQEPLPSGSRSVAQKVPSRYSRRQI